MTIRGSSLTSWLLFFMTSNRSFSNEASSQLTPLHAALAGTSLGTTTTLRGINHSLASEMLVIYYKIYTSLVLARRESRGGNLLLSGTVHRTLPSRTKQTSAGTGPHPVPQGNRYYTTGVTWSIRTLRCRFLHSDDDQIDRKRFIILTTFYLNFYIFFVRVLCTL